jgi:hypothetical protein
VWSARKHGITDDEMLQADRNPINAFAVDDMVSASSTRPIRPHAAAMSG